MIVLDTNVISELMRKPAAPAVVAWADSQPTIDLYLTAITTAELLYGIARLPDGHRKETLAEIVQAVRPRPISATGGASASPRRAAPGSRTPRLPAPRAAALHSLGPHTAFGVDEEGNGLLRRTCPKNGHARPGQLTGIGAPAMDATWACRELAWRREHRGGARDDSTVRQRRDHARAQERWLLGVLVSESSTRLENQPGAGRTRTR